MSVAQRNKSWSCRGLQPPTSAALRPCLWSQRLALSGPFRSARPGLAVAEGWCLHSMRHVWKAQQQECFDLSLSLSTMSVCLCFSTLPLFLSLSLSMCLPLSLCVGSLPLALFSLSLSTSISLQLCLALSLSLNISAPLSLSLSLFSLSQFCPSRGAVQGWRLWPLPWGSAAKNWEHSTWPSERTSHEG